MSKIKINDPIYTILLKNDNNIYIQCENDGKIIVFPTERRALDFWENGYKNSFNRGLCGSTGAMVAMITCQPRVVYFNNQNKVFEVLFNEPPFSKISINSINGILCQKDVTEVWNTGIEPKLIKIDT